MTSQTLKFCWLTALRSSIDANRSDAHHRFIQLASVTRDGAPRNRTLVFRGFDADDDSILLCTDRRSAKFDELVDCGLVEACWYFVRSREQYRLRGRVRIVDDAKKISKMWSRLSTATRAQFFWPTPLESVAEREDHVSISLNLKDVAPPDTFILLKVQAHLVDYLSLGEKHRRVISERADQAWLSRAVNP